MLFTSLEFGVFLIVAAAVFHLTPARGRAWVLLAASLLFYLTWSVAFAVLLLALTGLAYWLGARLVPDADAPEKRRAVTMGVILLFAPLVLLKYLNVVLVGLFGPQAVVRGLTTTDAVAAVGISYYTFKLVSYLVDIYWGRLAPYASFAALANYAAFFPQILCGPIQRAGSFAAELDEIAVIRRGFVASGLRLMLFGFFKKLVVADRLGQFVDPAFAAPDSYSGAALMVASYLFAIQLYADFSGLTDIAIGAGRLFGIASPRNFAAPFFAENIQDFWRRWHMTLTNWLGDYVFLPLRMALRERGQAGLVLSLFINMVAIGVWHGANWSFVVFGVLHASYMIGSTLSQRSRKKRLQRNPTLARVHRFVGPLVTFHMVVVSFIFFRAASAADGFYILSRALAAPVAALFSLGGAAAGAAAGLSLPHDPGEIAIAAWGVLMMEIAHALQYRATLAGKALRLPGWLAWSAYLVLGFAILIWGESGGKQFIYVRF